MQSKVMAPKTHWNKKHCHNCLYFFIEHSLKIVECLLVLSSSDPCDIISITNDIFAKLHPR